SYLATIYQDLNNFEDWRKTMEDRATNKCSKKDAQAQSYYAIGVEYWRCSYTQTNRYADKALVTQKPFHYRNMDYPDAPPDKQKSLSFGTNGLAILEKALQLDTEYVEAMFYKGLLYREQEKMTKDGGQRKELDQMAVKIAADATALQRKKEAAAAEKKAQEQAAPKS